ncbi:ABC transporter substrate-binding protein [Mesorhizobium waimense]|nr:ABC transporter substrate-binding protein [Mesorhizobium waimense]
MSTGINRRSVLKAAAAMGALTLSGTGQIFPAFAQEATPKRGGHFKIGMGLGSTADSIDPATWNNEYMAMLGNTVHGYLTEVGTDGHPVGGLAESWEATPDAKTWMFKLRQGVEFHNAKSLSADDVVASLNHHRGEGSASAAAFIANSIDQIRADGSGKVVITLKHGVADLPFLLSDYHLPIMPAKDGKADISGVGAGGYVLEKIDFGVKATATRFKNYWKSDAAWFDSVEALVILDATARTNALTTGQTHVLQRCSLATVHLLERNKNLQITSIAGPQHNTLPMFCDVAPFDNVDVRLALKYAIDRQQLLNTLLNGYGEVGNDHPIPSSDRFFAKELPQREFDPEKAKFHLNKAGLSNLKVSLSASNFAFEGAVDAALIYQQNAAKAGITIDVVREPNDGYYDNVWMKKPFCVAQWGGRATPDWMFSQVYAADAAWNDTHWKNPRFNSLLSTARAELDDSKRLEMYVEMQGLCRDDGGVIVPLFTKFVNALSKNVGHGKIGSNWDLDGFRCAERWWFTDV